MRIAAPPSTSVAVPATEAARQPSAAPAGAADAGLPATHPRLVVCDECDAVYARRLLAPGTVARCARCRAVLERGHRLDTQAQLALVLTALIVFVIGNAAHIVTLDLRGVVVEVTLHEAIAHTWHTGERLVAALAAATAFAFPLAMISLRLWLLVPMAAGRRPAGFVLAMRLLRQAERWSMVEVFLLGALIATVRSAGIASVVPGAGIFSFVVLALLLAALEAAGLRRLWRLGAVLPS